MAIENFTPPEGPQTEALAQDLLETEADTPRERAWRDWSMVGIGLTGVLSVLAVILAASALGTTNPTTTVAATPPPTGSGSSAKPEAVTLKLKSDTEHGKIAANGQWHDAFLPGDFTVHAGSKVTVTVYNYDSSPHSFTSSALSSGQVINQMISAGSSSAPSKTTFTFTAPSSPGKYSWWCSLPCDTYAMGADGFMKGYVTVAA